MTKSPLTKEDRDNLKKDLLNSGLINNQDGRETLCMDLGILDQAIYIGLPERKANDFATYLVNWLHKNNNQTALNKLCWKLLNFNNLNQILLKIQAKITLPTIPFDEARSNLLERVISYWARQNNKSEFIIKFKENNGNEAPQ